MAFNVLFYTFSKRKNSTLLPTGTGTSFSVVLKDNTSVMEPTLKLHGASSNFNPSSYNYCYIPHFSRYYFVSDWRYVPGYWECDLQTDVLATYKNQIGNQSKYVTRSSFTHDRFIIDEFYPAIGDITEIVKEHDFGFDINYGDFVLGIVNRDYNIGGIGGATSYYKVTESQLEVLKRYMYPEASETFQNLVSITMDVIRSIVNPWDWIVSCKRFPIDIPYLNTLVDLVFGQWIAYDPYGVPPEEPAQGYPLLNSDNWTALSHDFTISNDWLTKDAKYRSERFVKMYIACNPWGIIPLSASDFVKSNTVRVKIEPDFVTGNSLLKIFAVTGPLETLVSQHSANISVDTKLNSSQSNVYGGLGGIVQAGGGISYLASEAAPVMGAFNLAAGIANAAMNFTPSMSGSVGRQEGFMGLDGVCRLYVKSLNFADENNDEFGKPLCHTTILKNIPGFIKCGDGEHSISCYGNEKDIISDFMTSGFFYE